MTIKDGDWELFDWNPSLGRTVWRYDDGRTVHYRTDYDVREIVKNNEIDRNEASRYDLHKSEGIGVKVASIPMNIFYGTLAEAVNQGDNKYIDTWLNDGDNKAFTTR